MTFLFRKILFFVVLFMSSISIAQDQSFLRPYAEVYNETIGLRREDYNTVALLQAYQGLRTRLTGGLSWDIYLKERLGGDTQRDYWNNRGEFATGTWLRFSKGIFIGGFFEYIRGKYIGSENKENPNPYGKNYDDVRGGFVLWHGSDFEKEPQQGISFPMTFWDDSYGDAIYYRRDSHNYIVYMNPKAGIRLLRYNKITIEPYLVSYWLYDKNGDFWNNRFDWGAGIRMKPWSDIFLVFFGEYLNGSYIQRDGRYENPNPTEYWDVRFGMLFWFGWGY